MLRSRAGSEGGFFRWRALVNVTMLDGDGFYLLSQPPTGIPGKAM